MMPTPFRLTPPRARDRGEWRGGAILTLAALRALERRHASQPLMERAGEAAAQVALAMLDRPGAGVTVLAGPGNNGGDACIVARVLHQRGLEVEVLGQPPISRLSAEADAAWRAMRAAGVREIHAPPARFPALIIDGLFGIGLTRAIAEPWGQWIEWANRVGAPILALDIPSGLDASTGVSRAPAIEAMHTATFIALKPGLVTGDGPDHCGTISVHDLDLDDVEAVQSGTWLAWPALSVALPEVLARRRRVTHKGSFGTLVIAGGAEGMVGAPLLAGRAALALGAGRVIIELLARNAPRVDPGAPELMLREARLQSPDSARPVEESSKVDARSRWCAPDAQALVVGPGLGHDGLATGILASAIAREVPLVLDADALNLTASDASLADAIAARTAATVLTPHPAEAARLLHCDTATVQSDRVAAATELATRFRAIAVLKGAGSVIARPDGGFDINATGNPALSTAGSGDVLSGILGALLAQRIAAVDAARIAVCLHGAAADALVAEGVGPLGVRASEVIDRARALVNEARAPSSGRGSTRPQERS